MLADMAEQSTPLTDADRAQLEDIVARDNPFPAIDYRDFAARQGADARTPAPTA